MKKMILSLGLMVLAAGFVSCTKHQTELSGDNLTTKVKVYGFIEYTTQNKNGGSTDNEFSGTADVFYRPGADPAAGFTHTSVTVTDGAFSFELGCPAGQSMEVKVQAATYDDTYMNNSTQPAYFFGTATKIVACGSAVYIRVKMAPTVFPEDPDSNI